MLCEDGIKVLEYNARFGDPEAQVVLPRLKTDLFDVFEAVIDGTLEKLDVEYREEACVCVVAASGGYPERYEKGKEITFSDVPDDIMVFHAGTAKKDGKVVTSGGRVLGVTALGSDLKAAKARAYEGIKHISFDGMFYRHDICKIV